MSHLTHSKAMQTAELGDCLMSERSTSPLNTNSNSFIAGGLGFITQSDVTPASSTSRDYFKPTTANDQRYKRYESNHCHQLASLNSQLIYEGNPLITPISECMSTITKVTKVILVPSSKKQQTKLNKRKPWQQQHPGRGHQLGFMDLSSVLPRKRKYQEIVEELT